MLAKWLLIACSTYVSLAYLKLHTDTQVEVKTEGTMLHTVKRVISNQKFSLISITINFGSFYFNFRSRYILMCMHLFVRNNIM